MYNTSFECRYHSDDVFLDSDNVTDDVKMYIRDHLYREDFLNIFNVECQENTEEYKKVILELYNNIEESFELKNIIKNMANRVFSSDLIIGLMILYSYDYMHLTHLCVSEYLEKGTISQINLDLLNRAIVE